MSFYAGRCPSQHQKNILKKENKSMKKKTLISSLLTIVMCLALIAGSTYALFTSEDKINIAVTSATVKVTASIDQQSLKLYSMDVAQTANFENGGTAAFNQTTGDLTLSYITPGDKVSFNINVVNESNVAIQYCLTWTVNGELYTALVATVGTNSTAMTEASSDWARWESESNTLTIPVSIELPATVGDEYQDKSATISFKVEAIQGNVVFEKKVNTVEEFTEALANAQPGDVINASGVVVEPTGSLSTTVSIPAGVKKSIGESSWSSVALRSIRSSSTSSITS